MRLFSLYLEEQTKVFVFANETCKVRFEGNGIVDEDCLQTKGLLADLGLLKIVYDKSSVLEFINSREKSVGPVKNILLVADTENHCIRAIDFEEKMMSVIVGKCGVAGFKDGYMQSSRLSNPRGLGIDRRNRIYIDDFGNRQIRILDLDQNFETFQKFVSAAKINTLDRGSCFDLPLRYS